MAPALIDTDILSLFLRGHPSVVSRFKMYNKSYSYVSFSIVTYYEILSGLKHKDAYGQLSTFHKLSERCEVIPLTLESATVSADIYAEQRKKGTPVDDIDLLIAGTAIVEGRTMVTRNMKHFSQIEGLKVEDWSQAV